jgi:DNA-binding beta-propeller fold protein YncE
MNTIYALLEYDDFIAIIDGSTNEIKEKIIMQNPRAMSINPSAGLLYVASGDSFWFNIVDLTTHKVIGINTQISYPIASAVNNITGRVFVAECLECDDFDFTNCTSIYELDGDGSTIDWKTYENINIEENGLAINPLTNKLYAIGINTKSELSNLYVIDISSR